MITIGTALWIWAIGTDNTSPQEIPAGKMWMISVACDMICVIILAIGIFGRE